MRRALVVQVIAFAAAVACTGAGQTPGREAEGRPATVQPDLAATQSAPKTTPLTACELLSAAEIAASLQVPAVRIDPLNSGRNEMTHVDLCSWYVAEGKNDGVMVKLRQAPSAGEVQVSFIAARLDIDSSVPPARIPGVGDEALYAPYPDGAGGTIVFRSGVRAVTIIGSVPKDVLVSMAKLAVPRL